MQTRFDVLQASNQYLSLHTNLFDVSHEVCIDVSFPLQIVNHIIVHPSCGGMLLLKQLHINLMLSDSPICGSMLFEPTVEVKLFVAVKLVLRLIFGVTGNTQIYRKRSLGPS